MCPWAITQRQNTSTDLIDTRRRRISSLQSLSLTGIRSTCVTFLDTHQKENLILIQLKMKIIFFHMFMALNAYNTFIDEEKEIERLFGKLWKLICPKQPPFSFQWFLYRCYRLFKQFHIKHIFTVKIIVLLMQKINAVILGGQALAFSVDPKFGSPKCFYKRFHSLPCANH